MAQGVPPSRTETYSANRSPGPHLPPAVRYRQCGVDRIGNRWRSLLHSTGYCPRTHAAHGLAGIQFPGRHRARHTISPDGAGHAPRRPHRDDRPDQRGIWGMATNLHHSDPVSNGSGLTPAGHPDPTVVPNSVSTFSALTTEPAQDRRCIAVLHPLTRHSPSRRVSPSSSRPPTTRSSQGVRQPASTPLQDVNTPEPLT